MIAAVVSTPMVALNAQSAVAGLQDFRFHNNTPFTVEELYLSPSSSRSWEEDVLGRNVLFGNRSTVIKVDGYSSNECFFDIKVVFTDGSSIERRGFDLCTISDITVP